MNITYEINKLGNADFELLSQSLSQKIFGPSTIVFGDGPDGGREATYEGESDFAGKWNKWKGYWVIQAKYKSVRTTDEAKDVDWLINEIRKELEKYRTRKVKVKHPDNLIFFSNIILTPTAETGGRDQLSKAIQHFKASYAIPNISIFGADDIESLLNLNRDVAVAFSGFILSGDILSKLFYLLNKSELEKVRTKELLMRYLESEFKSNSFPKLEHAGKVTSEKINLEKVFIDLYATRDGRYPEKETDKFIAKMVKRGNSRLCPSLKRASRFVLIAGPGYGKSTLTQFLSQVYRAFFIKNIDDISNRLRQASDFINECEVSFDISPVAIRLPFKIVLKEFAGWILQRSEQSLDFSLVGYLAHTINKKCNEEYFTNEKIEEFFTNFSSVIIFDGLDEVPSSSNRDAVIQEINYFTDVLLRRVDADCLIIGTSRPQGYSKEFDTTTYSHSIITDLDKDSCKNYIRKLLDNIEEDEEKRSADYQILCEALNDNIVNRLMKSPLQASIMAILVRTGGVPPKNKYELFTEYYSTIFKREKQKNVANIIVEYQNYIDEIHFKLGFHLQYISESALSPTATISKPDFEKFVSDYLQNDIGLDAFAVKNHTTKIVEASIERLVFIEEVTDGFFGFTIRSFQEYFAANYFMQNVPDEDVKKRLESIRTTSYWHNTFLFCLGYLFKHKRYAIDYLEAICNDLNGANAPNDYSTLTSIYKGGSFLALDVLNEGIFRGQPTFENRFAKYLSGVLCSNFTIFYSELNKLPPNILLDWIIKNAELGVRNPNSPYLENYWGVLFSLNNNKTHINSSILEFWPKSTEQQYSLLRFLSKNRLLEGNLGKNVLLRFHADSSLFELYSILSEINLQFLCQLYQDAEDALSKTEFLTSILLGNYLGGDDDEWLDFVKGLLPEIANFHQGAHSDIFAFIHFSQRIFESRELSDEYIVQIDSIFFDDYAQLGKLNSFFSMFNIPILSQLTAFLLTPNTKTLSEVFNKLNLESSAFPRIRRILMNSNWLMHSILSNKSNYDSLLSTRILNGDFGNETDWLSFENSLSVSTLAVRDILKYANKREWGNMSPNELCRLIKKCTEENLSAADFVEEIDWLMSIAYHMQLTDTIMNEVILEDDVANRVLELIAESSTSVPLDFTSFIRLLELIPTATIIENVKEIDSIALSLSYGGFFYYSHSKRDLFQVLYELIPFFKTVKCVNIFKIIPHLLLHQDIKNLKCHSFSIDEFAEVQNDVRFGILRLLIIRAKYEGQFDGLQEWLKKVILDKFKQSVLLHTISRLKIVDSALENFLLDLRAIIDPEKSNEYISTVRVFVESQPSQLPQLQ